MVLLLATEVKILDPFSEYIVHDNKKVVYLQRFWKTNGEGTGAVPSFCSIDGLFVHKEEITKWVADFLTSMGDESLYLVDVLWSKKNRKLEVFIESDGNLTLGDVQNISREMQRSLENENLLGDSYRLDVSSPGVDRPLKLRRQYLKNIGRIVCLQLIDDQTLAGRIKEVGEEHLVIEPEIPGYKKKKPTYGEPTSVNWEDIKQTIVQIRF